MEKKSFLVVALALWLIAAALAGLSPSARALPNHVVTGGVYGPGNNVQPGPANPANPASAVYYSTTQPTYPVLVETDITDADGTLPASFATDVGASWSWLPGDEVVVVVETVRGVNGWAAVNYTTSVDGVLATGSIQDIGSGTAEQDPPLTLISGSTDINVTWRALTDTNANVRSYIVFRGPGPLGPFTPIGTVTHAGSASLYQDDMGLAPGTYCYQLAINYRRDTTGVSGAGVGSGHDREQSRSRLPPEPLVVHGECAPDRHDYRARSRRLPDGRLEPSNHMDDGGHGNVHGSPPRVAELHGWDHDERDRRPADGAFLTRHLHMVDPGHQRGRHDSPGGGG